MRVETLNENKIIERNETQVSTEESLDTFGMTCGDFLDAEFQNSDQVMFGLNRGSVGMIVGGTNQGKSTLALNLSIAIGCNASFYPLFGENYTAKRVLYVDGEATEAQLQADINKMLENCSDEEKEMVRTNLCLICDQEIESETGNEPLNIANVNHLKRIEEIATEFNPDLIIFDTLSALANLNENDNVKARNLIIQPLKDLAKKVGAGVLLIHHTGKAKNQRGEYKARGASAWGTLSRVVINLDYDEFFGGIVLSCSKVKGERFDSLVMAINQNTRWFEIIEDYSGIVKTKAELDYEKVVDFVREANRKVKKREIDEAFTTTKEMSVAKIGRILSSAYNNGDLGKDYGFYFGLPISGEPENDLILDFAGENNDLGLAE